MDPRIEQLARNLVQYSCRLKKGEKVLIEARDPATEPLVRQIIKEVYAAGGQPFVNFYLQTIERELLKQAGQEQLQILAERDRQLMDQLDAYISVRAQPNASELSDVGREQMQRYTKTYLKPVHYESRLLNTKWVVLHYPNGAMAQQAGMSTESFEDYYFRVCTLDYSRMNKAMGPLKSLMEKTDQVRIEGPGTDLRFSIQHIPVVKCAGWYNIPDGEVYTAPVRNTVQGTISYNTPSLHEGFTYENIRFTFQDGKIVDAAANDTDRLNHVLDTDAGARYVGEFAIGVNPHVTKPMKNTLFDERIMGSIHFTPGNSYEDADNGNRSAVHWDLVLIQTETYGGGRIYFDDVLIRENGRFVLPELIPLNPEHLMD